MKKILLILFLFGCENTITDDNIAAIEGCTYEFAPNYNPEAVLDDGSCEEPIVGCTDESASNYDSEATVDDSSCEYESSPNFNIVINEINYKSSLDLDSGDWIELYNPTDEAIEISLWEFRDEGNLFTLPENTILAPENYLVLCRNLDVFSQVFESVSNVLGDFEFGLNPDGELLRLFDPDGLLVDEVEYDDIAPWPIDPNGYGPTLELIDSSLDNALGESWSASSENGGTPGEINSVVNE